MELTDWQKRLLRNMFPDGDGDRIIEWAETEFAVPEDDEPQRPINCTNCDLGYDLCTRQIQAGRKACCHACEYTVTHEQDEWEAWKRRNP